MAAPVTPRAVGPRVDLTDAPPVVLSWIESTFGGRIVEARTQVGGMSPGPAARVLLDSGRRLFVKAVGTTLNTHTPRLFRREVAVLQQLPVVDYRPSLLASYDDGDWVALVLEDVEGTHPDLDDDAVLAAARDVVRRQSAELTPDPLRSDEQDLAVTAVRWSDEIHASSQRHHLPAWWRADADVLLTRIASLPGQLPTESFCHLDIRDDNMLVRGDGSVVILDWGMSRAGTSWVDEVLLDLHLVDRPEFDAHVDALPSYAGATQSASERDEAVTTLLLTLGTSLALLALGDSHGLPHLSEFRRRESVRILAGAARRLGV